MPDTHVPLDEAEFIKWAYYNKEASLTGTQAREVWKYISNLKHTICMEIEELRQKTISSPIPVPNGMCHVCDKALVNRNKNSSYCRECLTNLQKQRVNGSTRRSGYNQAIDDALSVKSLKESE